MRAMPSSLQIGAGQPLSESPSEPWPPSGDGVIGDGMPTDGGDTTGWLSPWVGGVTVRVRCCSGTTIGWPSAGRPGRGVCTGSVTGVETGRMTFPGGTATAGTVGTLTTGEGTATATGAAVGAGVDTGAGVGAGVETGVGAATFTGVDGAGVGCAGSRTGPALGCGVRAGRADRAGAAAGRSTRRPPGAATMRRVGLAVDGADGNGAASTEVAGGGCVPNPSAGTLSTRPSKRGNATAPATATASKIAATKRSIPLMLLLPDARSITRTRYAK